MRDKISHRGHLRTSKRIHTYTVRRSPETARLCIASHAVDEASAELIPEPPVGWALRWPQSIRYLYTINTPA